MNNPTKLLNTDIIAMEVPKTAESIIKKGTKICFYEHSGAYPNEKEIDLGFDFEILGEATEDEISFHFDLKPYVGIYGEMLPASIGVVKKFYNSRFRSLLQASGLNWVNEIKEPCLSCADNCNFDKCLEWQEAESKRIKGKLIFLKIAK